MSIEKKLLGTTPVSGVVDPEGVSFDGTNDYLSRSSDLTGNADGKTFTFSAWVYYTEAAGIRIYYAGDAFSGSSHVTIAGGGYVQFLASNSAGATILSAGWVLGDATPRSTWTHILISIDLTSTSSRYVFQNDVDISNNITWSTYTNDNINFTRAEHLVGAYDTGSPFGEGRLAHVFLDYTYRNLSTESNRRLFIDSDGKPSSTIPSSPIIYLPMTDAATAGSNSGTGGDFTVNGVLDTAGRGPNQWNCSASKFDGTNDYLETTSLSVPADNKLLTFSYCHKSSLTDGSQKLDFIDASDPTNVMKLCLRLDHSWDNTLEFTIYNGTDLTTVASGKYDPPGGVEGQNHCVQISLDTSDTSKRHAFIDGVDVTSSFAWNNYNNLNIPWSRATKAIIGDDFNYGDKLDGSLGEYWVDNSYTDLSSDNPFWDSVANKPKPVSQVISETGTTPIIAMPLRGNDAGNNLGSGGDFTVYSGPFTGARGGSEFWARGIKTTTNTSYLEKSLSSVGSFTIATAFSIESGGNAPLHISGQSALYFESTSGNVKFYNSSSSLVVDFSTSGSYGTGWHTVLVSVNLSTNVGVCYVNGSSVSITTNNMSSYSTVNFSNMRLGYESNTQLGAYYFNDTYTDFSQESNRNLFVDQLGYPKDLTPAIEAGTIADPLIYMKFDDTSALGTNSGTGGNFTVNGTVTAGADVDPN